jgi:hypothetical protein
MAPVLPPPRRLRIPFLIDLVLISDPDQIRQVEDSGDVDRLHSYETARLPWWVRKYFRATRFHDDATDSWFLPFESATNPSYAPRRAYFCEKIAAGYTAADVQRIANLLRANADDETLAHELAQVVDRRFFGAELPLAITNKARETLSSLGEALSPRAYARASHCQRDVTAYCAQTLRNGEHLADATHNIGTVVINMTRALRLGQTRLDTPASDLFTANPLTLQAPRIAVRSSRLGGLLGVPMKEGWTIVIFQIGAAAKATKDIWFTFGTGRTKRACLFKDFFLAFVTDVQAALKKRN